MQKIVSRNISHFEVLKVKIETNNKKFAINGMYSRNGHSDGCWWCGYDIITKTFPEFEILVRLVDSNLEGEPNHCLDNGLYHLKNKFEIGINYLRLENNVELVNILKEQVNTLTHLGLAKLLFKYGIIEQWKKEADEAIKLIESL